MLDKIQNETAPAAWAPRFPVETEMTPKKFDTLVKQYQQFNEANPVEGPLTLTDGWHTITAEEAEELLRRNHPEANRKLAYGTVEYYAEQMLRGGWPKTGQSLIFDENGVLVDGQHRLWAALLSGVAFTTFVVTNVPAIPRLFAYIDNNRPRNPAAALQTAGFNGVSALISQVIKIDHEFPGYTTSDKTKMPRLSPIEIVERAEQLPNAQGASHRASADWEDAVAVVGYKEVVAFIAMTIMDNFDDATADEFMVELGAPDETDPRSDCIRKFVAMMALDAKKERRMKRHQVLGNLIKVFNAWIARQILPKRWQINVTDDFPVVLRAEQVNVVEAEADAAE